MDREALPLWKLVVGVALGVLVADLVRMAWIALTISSLVGAWGFNTSNPGKVTERVTARSAPVELPAYQGPITARARGISRACINGTVFDRSGNGWAQSLKNNRPQPCRASSQ
ncbi:MULTISPECIES: hypothetical protein [unclassified Lysobacter]